MSQPPPNPHLHAFASLLLAASQSGCSDVHVRANSPPWGRRSGRLVPLCDGSVGSEAIAGFVQATAQRVVAGTSVEYSFDIGDKLRARCHAFRDADGWALAVRLVPPSVPSFADLRLPPVIKTFAEPRPGLLLITGPMGSGKSTTAAAVLKTFMLPQTREDDIALFYDISNEPRPERVEDIPVSIAVPAFMLSELTTSFRMGLFVFIPLLLVDLLVAAILMSFGMMMVPPQMVGLPLKIAVFLLADGWHLVVASLARGFHG